MGHRVARLDELGPPSGAAPTAGFDGLGAGVSGDARVAAIDEGAAHPAADADAAAAPVAELGVAGGDATPSRGVRTASETEVRPAAPVAGVGAADGQHTSGSALARLGEAGVRPRPHQEPKLTVRHGSGLPTREHPPGDPQRSRGGRARPGGDVAERSARDQGARRGGPSQIDPDADPVAAAREVCLRLLTDRAHTRHELAQALRQRGVPDEAAGAVLERFDEVGLIDDAAFAGQYVRSRHNQRGLSRRAIAMELRRKGVDDDVAEEALEEVDDDAEAGRARELVDRKLRTVPADTPEQRKKAASRLVGMLARKGYGGGIAYRVVREALAAHGAEIDELGTDVVD